MSEGHFSLAMILLILIGLAAANSTVQPQMLNTSWPWPQHPEERLPVGSLAFSADGKKIATYVQYGDTSIWDVASGTKIQTMNFRFEGGVMSFSPDGSKLVGINDRDIQIWDVASGDELQSMNCDPGTILVAFSSDSSKLITCDIHGTTSTWDVKRGVLLQNSKHGDGRPLDSEALSSDGSKLATSNDANRTTRIWDVASGTKLQELEHDHPVSFMAFNFDGSKLATYSVFGSYCDIWDVASGTKLKEFYLDKAATPALAFSPDGNKLAFDSFVANSSISIWDVVSGTKIQTMNVRWASGVMSFSPDGSKFAMGGGYDGFTRIWDVTKTITTSTSKKSDEKSPFPVASLSTAQNTTSNGNSSKLQQKSSGLGGILAIAALLCIYILRRKD